MVTLLPQTNEGGPYAFIPRPAVVATFRSRQSPPVAAEDGVELISCDFERSFSFSGFTLKAEVV